MVKDKVNKATQAKECSNTAINKDKLAMMTTNLLNQHPHHLNHQVKVKELDILATKGHPNLVCHTASDHKADQLAPNSKEVTNQATPKTLNKTTVTLVITHLIILLATLIPPPPLNPPPTRKTNADKVDGASPTDLTKISTVLRLHCNLF